MKSDVDTFASAPAGAAVVVVSTGGAAVVVVSGGTIYPKASADARKVAARRSRGNVVIMMSRGVSERPQESTCVVEIAGACGGIDAVPRRRSTDEARESGVEDLSGTSADGREAGRRPRRATEDSKT
jgi:xanthine/CO dehydrogenase XdhC/CoxF family maturation factor